MPQKKEAIEKHKGKPKTPEKFLQFWPKPTSTGQGRGVPIGDPGKKEEKGNVKDVEEMAKDPTVPGHNSQDPKALQQVKKRIPPI